MDSSLDPQSSAGAPPPASPAAPSAPKVPAKPAGKPPAVVVESTPDPPVNKIRRRIVWASVVGFLTTCFLMFVRFFLPRAIFEPSSTFKIGFPGDYALGVDTKYQQQYRIWVDKTSDRLFVVYARCTHLGCTPDWKPSENKFKCPCHGSGYDSEGDQLRRPGAAADGSRARRAGCRRSDRGGREQTLYMAEGREERVQRSGRISFRCNNESVPTER